jgi:ribosomal protein L20A (L18A)
MRLESAQIQPTGLHTHFLSNNGSRRKAKRIVIKIKAKEEEEEDKATCNSVVAVSTVTNQLARLSPLPDVVNEQKTMGIVRERETSSV